MTDFAKIVVVDGQQVLFYTEPDPEHDDKTKLNQIVQMDGYTANIAVGGISDDSGLIERLGEEDAKRVLKAVKDLMEEP